ncbi:hypothetical protein MOK15_20990 [Sphingobium sp. BYY-5]|uniref:hypothetical protein n=1 Tax=Sphingobium sp. BYY-5 TaxID=2926400 RepID=UPI001FA802A7|nr:hypothetical protein [Sphingobium sp. BYY-5]MCI4592539.1 hypothetical protein [Sphingobium sp. BYY-5]
MSKAGEEALQRICLLNALSIASGGLATIFMGDEVGLLNDHDYLTDPTRAHEGRWVHRPEMDWFDADSPTAQRISSDIRVLRDARVASRGIESPAAFETGHTAILGMNCGQDLIFLNFGAIPLPLTLPSGRINRLTGQAIGQRTTIDAWDVLWTAAAQ